jgi:hypothetical protein
MATKRPRRPRDPNVLAKLIVDMATGNAPKDQLGKQSEGKRKGGLAGGKARAKALDTKTRRAIARKAALARWGS